MPRGNVGFVRDRKFDVDCTEAFDGSLKDACIGWIAYAPTMSTRRSRPPRGRKSRNPEAPPSEVQVILPPATTVADERGAQSDPPSDELAALEAGWDELLA
jgi:hypothetical protein